tara:strand:- start:28 stop:510 length:483 start_codon:yes stop_codon:yes gene_type:complete
MTRFLSSETITTWQIWLFGFTRIPLIFFCRPKVIHISEHALEVKIKLNRKTRNHLNSMYFGVLSVGADITGGFLAMKKIQAKKSNISLIFKDFHANFLKRAEGDVHFKCDEGALIKELVKKAEETGKRVSMPIHIIATVPSLSLDPIANFVLTLSLKKNR